MRLKSVVQGNAVLILTILESKGLEFKDGAKMHAYT